MSYTNGFNDGYKKGYDDGYIHQRKSSLGGFGISEIARCCISPQTYLDTFTEGYENGFKDGIFLYNQEKTIKNKIEIILNANI